MLVQSLIEAEQAVMITSIKSHGNETYCHHYNYLVHVSARARIRHLSSSKFVKFTILMLVYPDDGSHCHTVVISLFLHPCVTYNCPVMLHPVT